MVNVELSTLRLIHEGLTFFVSLYTRVLLQILDLLAPSYLYVRDEVNFENGSGLPDVQQDDAGPRSTIGT